MWILPTGANGCILVRRLTAVGVTVLLVVTVTAEEVGTPSAFSSEGLKTIIVVNDRGVAEEEKLLSELPDWRLEVVAPTGPVSSKQVPVEVFYHRPEDQGAVRNYFSLGEEFDVEVLSEPSDGAFRAKEFKPRYTKEIQELRFHQVWKYGVVWLEKDVTKKEWIAEQVAKLADLSDDKVFPVVYPPLEFIGHGEPRRLNLADLGTFQEPGRYELRLIWKVLRPMNEWEVLLKLVSEPFVLVIGDQASTHVDHPSEQAAAKIKEIFSVSAGNSRDPIRANGRIDMTVNYAGDRPYVNSASSSEYMYFVEAADDASTVEPTERLVRVKESIEPMWKKHGVNLPRSMGDPLKYRRFAVAFLPADLSKDAFMEQTISDATELERRFLESSGADPSLADKGGYGHQWRSFSENRLKGFAPVYTNSIYISNYLRYQGAKPFKARVAFVVESDITPRNENVVQHDPVVIYSDWFWVGPAYESR